MCMPTASDAIPLRFVDSDIVANRGYLAGWYRAELDGVQIKALCDDVTVQIYGGQTWDVDIWSYLNLKGKSLSASKYSQAAYLFDQSSLATDANKLADINAAIWKIMNPAL